MAANSTSVLIVGAGCFGVSTAYHLLKRGYTDVTVLDRSPTLPAPDAASTDINKIVRSSYSDVFYSGFAREALRAWKEEAWTDGVYHESEVLLVGGSVYSDHAYENDVKIGARVEQCTTPAAVRAHIPPATNPAFEGFAGYLNRDGGWVESGRAVALLLAEIARLGAHVVAGCRVSKLVQDGGRTTGVECEDGRTFGAEKIVLALGSWTASAFEAELGCGLETRCLATGQTVAKIQLTDEEAKRYSGCPVVLDFQSGFYMFPPTTDGVIKVAIHNAGFTHRAAATRKAGVSTPRTVLSDGEDGLRIPRSAVRALRASLRKMYPELADKPFAATRLCWYTESPDETWHIGPHPTDPALFFATGGSGHAFKFFPVLGRLVADALEGKMDAALASKFALDRTIDRANHLSRPLGLPRDLGAEELCTYEDLAPCGISA